MTSNRSADRSILNFASCVDPFPKTTYKEKQKVNKKRRTRGEEKTNHRLMAPAKSSTAYEYVYYERERIKPKKQKPNNSRHENEIFLLKN